MIKIIRMLKSLGGNYGRGEGVIVFFFMVLLVGINIFNMYNIVWLNL